MNALSSMSDTDSDAPADVVDTGNTDISIDSIMAVQLPGSVTELIAHVEAMDLRGEVPEGRSGRGLRFTDGEDVAVARSGCFASANGIQGTDQTQDSLRKAMNCAYIYICEQSGLLNTRYTFKCQMQKSFTVTALLLSLFCIGLFMFAVNRVSKNTQLFHQTYIHGLFMCTSLGRICFWHRRLDHPIFKFSCHFPRGTYVFSLCASSVDNPLTLFYLHFSVFTRTLVSNNIASKWYKMRTDCERCTV